VWRAGVHPDDLARVEAAIERCADPRGDGVYDIEYRVIGKMDGVERWIATRGQTNFENDVPVPFFGVAMEITDRKRIKERSSAALKSGRANWRRPTSSYVLKWSNGKSRRPSPSNCNASTR